MSTPELINYFVAEKHGGFLLSCLGLVSVALAGYLWMNRSSFVAIAWPLVIVGIFQLVIGLTVALRSDSQVVALQKGLQIAARSTATTEIHRMDRINGNFRIVKAVEVGFILIGLGLVLLFPKPGTWSAVGLGLLVEAAVLLAFDVFAHQRALLYTTWLRSLVAV